jgi:hypothetical protein
MLLVRRVLVTQYSKVYGRPCDLGDSSSVAFDAPDATCEEHYVVSYTYLGVARGCCLGVASSFSY